MLWDAIVNEYAATLIRVAYRILQNTHDAEDVTQEVLLEAFHMDRVPDLGLLRRMATLRAIDHLRRKRHSTALDESTAMPSHPHSHDSDRSELIGTLQTAIAKLPERQAECFWLRFVEDMTNQQIAHALNITPSAVSTAIGKAKIALRDTFQFEAHCP